MRGIRQTWRFWSARARGNNAWTEHFSEKELAADKMASNIIARKQTTYPNLNPNPKVLEL